LVIPVVLGYTKFQVRACRQETSWYGVASYSCTITSCSITA